MNFLIIIALVLGVTALIVVGDAPEYAIILGIISIALVVGYWATV